MLKPLARIMPSLSGNIKLVGFLNDLTQTGEETFETFIREAQIIPLTSSLYSKYMPISLLNSSYEWDLMTFYRIYPQYFYEKLFDYSKIDLQKYSLLSKNVNRNSDFEYGVKRISFEKSYGKQLAFFAPIYIESEKDLPDTFEITITLQNSLYETTKKIIINIGKDVTNSKNYFGQYLYNYATKIDDNVVFLSYDTGHAVYYGINVQNGGFNQLKDITVNKIFNRQNTIVNFDNIICQGFERNKLVMRQILPLCFYFNINDILVDEEKENFYGATMKISGAYFKDGFEVLMHDFDHDYSFYQPKITQMNLENGSDMHVYPYPLSNIMNIGYPSLRESLFWKYRFTNKISPNITRWKLKYSNDTYPYITNASPAFSMHQNSLALYKEFPRLYPNVTAVLSKRKSWLNLVLPFGEGKSWYTTKVYENYKTIRNNFATTWFETLKGTRYERISIKKVIDNWEEDRYFYKLKTAVEYDKITSKTMAEVFSIEDRRLDETNTIYGRREYFKQTRNIDDILHYSVDVNKDRKCYFNGILYNLSYLYNAATKPLPNIDKFGVFIYPVFDAISEDDIMNKLYYSNNVILREHGKYINNPNCLINDDMLVSPTQEIFNDIDPIIITDEILHNEVFTYNEKNDGDFIDLRYYNMDWYDINKFYRMDDILNDNYIPEKFWTALYKHSSEGFDIVPIHRSSNFTTCSELYYSDFNSAKVKIEEDIEIPETATLYDYSFFRKSHFISYQDLVTYVSELWFNYEYKNKGNNKYLGPEIEKHANEKTAEIISYIEKANVITYQFNPTLTKPSGEIYTTNVFTSNDWGSPRFYGDKLPYNEVDKDIDFLYIDTYNYNNIINHYNKTWLKNDEKLAYITNGSDGLTDPTFSSLWNSTLSSEIHEEITNDFYAYHVKYAEWGYNAELDEKYEPSYYKRYELTLNYNDDVKLLIEDKSKYYKFRADITQEEIDESQYNIAKNICIIGKDNTYVNNQENNKELKRLLELIYMERNYTYKYFNGYKWLMLDNFSSNDGFIKFLDLRHVKYFIRILHQTYLNKVDMLKSFNDIYIRRRILTEDATVKDIFIKFTDVFNIDGLLIDEVLDVIYKELRFDTNTQLFYFNHLTRNTPQNNSNNVYKNVNSFKTAYIHKDVFYDPSLYINSDGKFDSTKCQFELVYKRKMIKVNDDIWNLINLEERYAAPYKDLYIYEIEEDTEFNAGEKIYQQPIIGETQLYRKVFKPLFNIVEIEAKDKTQIYAEYSVHSITKTEIENPLDSLHPIYHFYRHNKNNTNVMYDMSWLDRNVPIDIHGEKFIYAYSSLAKDNDTNLYSYFHHTYDKYKSNIVKFINYSEFTSYNTLYEVIPIYSTKTVDTISYYSPQSFAELYKNEYDELNKLKDKYASYNDVYWRFTNEETLQTWYGYLSTHDEEYISEYSYIYKNLPSYVFTDHLGLFDKYGLSSYIYNVNGEEKIAAFYVINSTFNNTINSLTMNTYSGEYCKYLSYINGVNVIENPDYVPANYKRLLPFIKNYPLKYFLASSLLACYPKVISIPEEYEIKPVNNDSGKLAYYDICNTEVITSENIMERYFDNIVPVITEKSNINSYMLKFKNSDLQFEPTYFTNEVIYNQEISFNRYPGLKVYNLEDNSYEFIKEREYKFYNDNKYFNLENEIRYTYPKGLTRVEVAIAQLDSEVFKVFIDTIKTNHQLSVMSDTDIEWAFSQYSVSFETVFDEMDLDIENKLYELTIIFRLH